MHETKMSLRFKVKKCTLSFDFFGVFFLGPFLLQNINQNKKIWKKMHGQIVARLVAVRHITVFVNLLKPTKTMDHQLLY